MSGDTITWIIIGIIILGGMIYSYRKDEKERIERERYTKIMTKKEVQALQRAQIEELFRNNYSTWG